MRIKSLTKTEKKALTELKYFYSCLYYLFVDTEGRYGNEKGKQKEFVAIPMSDSIIDVMARIKKTFPDKKVFLDVGCGKGNVLYLAKYFGLHPRGIEFRKEYKQYHGDMDIFYGRAEETKSYPHADIIYLYRPMKEDKDLQHLMNIILQKCRAGTVLILCGFSINEKDPRVNRLRYNKPYASPGIYIRTTKKLEYIQK